MWITCGVFNTNLPEIVEPVYQANYSLLNTNFLNNSIFSIDRDADVFSVSGREFLPKIRVIVRYFYR